MSDVGLLKPLSAFEWASVSRYIVYISSVAGLKEINTNHVISFSLTRLGVKGLVRQKERVLLQLRKNMGGLECFAEEHRGELEKEEISVLRSMYVQIRGSIAIVEGHIRMAERYANVVDDGLLLEGETEVTDEPLF